MKNQKINMSILIFLIIFQTILVSSARSVSPWTPNTSDPPPGTYEHVGGFTYTAAEGPLYTNIEEIRVDFWHVEETDTLVMSITIENGTGDKQGNNIFNQGAPASIKQDVNDFIDLFDDILNLPQINTIWDLITDGVHSVNLVAKRQNLLTSGVTYTSFALDSEEDYPYLDAGNVLYSNKTTLAYAKDIDLALITINCSYSEFQNNQNDLEAYANKIIGEMNQFFKDLFDVATLFISSDTHLTPTLPQVSDINDMNDAVPYVLDHLSFQYGDNYSGSLIPNYPFLILGIISVATIYVLIKKRILSKKEKKNNDFMHFFFCTR